MGNISLRAYNREIEGLIDANQIDEAVAHCRYILQSFPKHIATYRLLGKAFLESQRYGDAADVFQRVLSAVPDDFVTHVGMSIIREDESNLDAAIWHMERAFEAQSSNTAIQDELRRLYGRRDGLEPPKVRLTRGALARLYAKGDLYQQAIGELRAALAEDPHRPDLQVILAQAYYLAGQRVEAVETCSALLKKLPNCLEANRLLAIILPDTERKEDTQVYRQRVILLDPYYAHAGPRSLTSDAVPDNAISLDRLQWKPGQSPTASAQGQPSWAASIGVAFEQTGGQELPGWLGGGESSAPALDSGVGEMPALPAFTENLPGPFAWEEKTAETPAADWLTPPAQTTETAEAPALPADVIPDWMKQAGWEPATGAAQEGPLNLEEEALPTEGELARAELPDWLKEVAPSDLIEAQESAVSAPLSEEGPTLPWLQEKQPGESDTIVTWLGQKEEQPAAAAAAPEAELPDWLKGFSEAPAAPEETLPSLEAAAPSPTEELPAWMQSPEETGAPLQPPLAEAQAEIPDWLQAAAEEKVSSIQPPAPAEGLPDWLASLESEPTAPAEEADLFKTLAVEQPPQPTPPTPAEALPAWLTAMGAESEAAPAESLPDWLSGIQAEEVTQPPQAEPAAEMPDWIKEMAIPPEAEGFAETVPPPAEAPAPEIPAEEAAGLAWLESLAARQGAPQEELLTRPEERPAAPPEWTQTEAPISAMMAEELPSAETEFEVPDWLKAAEAAPPVETVSPAVEAAAPAEEIPEWLKAAEAEAQAAEAPAAAETAAPSAEAALPPIPEGEEAALAWLESLAAKQGVPQEELITRPEERPAAPPEWVAEAPAAEEEQPITTPEPILAMEPPPAESIELPEWLKESGELPPEEPLVTPLWSEAPAPAAEEQAEEYVWLPAQKEVEAPQAEAEPAKLDINTASLAELERLPGIGFVLAQSIIAYREAYGPYQSVADLEKISGIGPVLVKELKDLITAIPPEAKPPKKVTRPLERVDETVLTEARQAIRDGDIESAIAIYTVFINKKQNLADITRDLEEALYRHPLDIMLWQTLGDAYARSDQLQAALDAYTKAEELLR